MILATVIAGLCLVAALAVYLVRLHRRAKAATEQDMAEVSIGESEWLQRDPSIRFRRIEGHD